MASRGPRLGGPPPHPSFRQRGGVRVNNPIAQHSIANNSPAQHHGLHHISQGQQRVYQPNMNQSQWVQQHPMNNNVQPEQLNYTHYPTDTTFGHSYQFQHHNMNTTPQPTHTTTFAYSSQMFQPPGMLYMQGDPTCFSQPPLVTTPPMPVPPMENVTTRKFHYNSKDNVTICVNCHHKNSLAETELIKRDEKIERLEKELEEFRKQNEIVLAENADLRLKLEALQSLKKQEIEMESTDSQSNVNAKVQPATDNESISQNTKITQLSVNAGEFIPKTAVPVVSAKGVLDEDNDAPTTCQVNEIDVGTQIDESLFEKPEEPPATEPEPVDQPAETEDSAGEVTTSNWCDEVEKSEKGDSLQEPKVEVNTEVTPVVDSSDWNDNAPLPTATAVPLPNWRDNTSQNNSTSDHWQNNRINRSDPDHSFNDHNRQDNYRQNFNPNNPHNRGVYSNSGPRYQKNVEERDYQNRRNIEEKDNVNRRNYEERENVNRRNYEERDQNRFGQRYDGRQHRNQRYRSNEHQEEEPYRENRSRERESHLTESSHPEKHEEKDANGMKDRSTRSAVSKEKQIQENSDTKRMIDNATPTQGAWKDQKFHFTSDGKKDSAPPKSNLNHGQGKYPYRAQPNYPDIVKEVAGDLFSAPADFALAHCVAQDFRMGSGIAVKFKEEFKGVGELLDQNVIVGGCAHLQRNNRYIFYLVTKEVSIGKPTYDTLRASLRTMRSKCLRFGVKKLAMPRIGCGLDKLDWSRVKSSINEIFNDTGIEIQVYEFNVERLPESEGNKGEGKRLTISYQHGSSLVSIAPGSALLFLGTEDGYMDPTAISINRKQHFERDYYRAKKTTGNIVHFETSSDYWVYGLIVSKSKEDSVSFTAIEKCCGQLSKSLRNNNFYYAGIEYPQNWSEDKLFFEKILSVFRTSLSKSVELWAYFPNPELDVLKPIKDNRDKEREARERAHPIGK